MPLPYGEGTVFLVPLRDGGHARGVIARMPPKGGVLLGYFFGPRLDAAGEAELTGLEPGSAILRLRFGDLGLLRGKWPIVGPLPNWHREAWPMPLFVRRDPVEARPPVLVTYSDRDPGLIDSERAFDGAADHGADVMSGAGAVEIKLTRLLAGPSPGQAAGA